MYFCDIPLLIHNIRDEVSIEVVSQLPWMLLICYMNHIFVVPVVFVVQRPNILQRLSQVVMKKSSASADHSGLALFPSRTAGALE
jgi:hypothetical protein